MIAKTAKLISIVLGPQVWFPLLIVLFLFKTDLSQKQQLILTPLLLTFFIIIPFGVLYILIKIGNVEDWDIRRRQERYKILSIFIVSTLINMAFVYLFGTKLSFHLSLILWLVSLVGTSVTFFWKISLHVILNTAAIIMINFLFDWKLPILYIFIPIVAWARYYHKHHTIWQIIIGILVGGIITLLGLIYFGYI
ncbi:MAG: hypothetical protein Q7K55_07860 [Candidatus Levybacteria bacterium]|nr:hypothetical protein [Candidatus Levybacteria bacterium]